jgi:hypothetical protein
VWAKAQEHGKAAASWVFDGNTPQDTYRYFIRGIEDGDPAVLEGVREPSLSGEYGDDYSEDELMADVGWVPHDGTDLRDELAHQYNEEVSAAFWHEVERLARLRQFHHAAASSETQHGVRRITCTCGHESSWAHLKTVERNFEHHLKTAREA